MHSKKFVIPNFLIIGAQKAGTTSLINYLAKHPDIFVPDHKEISGFYHDENYNKRFKDYPYVRYFDNWQGQEYAGNAPVNLLYFAEETSKRIYAFNPSMKLIAILRNPVQRAYSAYWYFVRCGLETESFESALKREERMLEHGNFYELMNFTYVSHGLYYHQLVHFLRHFGREQLLILLYDDFKNNPSETLRHIYAFLEVKEYFQSDCLNKQYNVSSRPKKQGIHNFIYRDHPVKKIYKKMLPGSFRYKVRMRLIRPILRGNLVPFNYPPMKAPTKQYLARILEESNDKLQKLLRRDLSHWQF